MGPLIKIVIVGVNSLCLLITLAYPNDGTVFSLLPVIVTASSWMIDSARKTVLSRYNAFLVLFPVVTACVCCFLGSTCTLTAATDTPANYFFKFRDDVAFLGGISFSYIPVCIVVGLVFLGLSIIEVVVSTCTDRTDYRIVPPLSFDDIVDNKLNS